MSEFKPNPAQKILFSRMCDSTSFENRSVHCVCLDEFGEFPITNAELLACVQRLHENGKITLP